MAKFVIKCPKCGRYAQARTGFFARKKIDCACGNVIDVRTDRLSSRTCSHYGNDVVFDQSTGTAAKCPGCGQPINTVADQDKTVEFTCAQCGVRHRAYRGAAAYTCPVCDHVNDIAEQVKKPRSAGKVLPASSNMRVTMRLLCGSIPLKISTWAPRLPPR